MDEDTYRRELVARLFGGKLSARQYGVLMNYQDSDKTAEPERLKIQNIQHLKTIESSKVDIRNAEEILESHRREMVLSGKWNESESRDKLQQKLFEFQKRFPTKASVKLFTTQLKQKKEQELLLERQSDHKQEREYYFDEGLGQSLDDHIKELKERYPKDMKLQTRRDRDGFAIIKLSFQREFKYNLNEIINVDAKEMERIGLETNEAVLRELVPEDPKEFLRALNGKSVSENDYLNKD